TSNHSRFRGRVESGSYVGFDLALSAGTLREDVDVEAESEPGERPAAGPGAGMSVGPDGRRPPTASAAEAPAERDPPGDSATSAFRGGRPETGVPGARPGGGGGGR